MLVFAGLFLLPQAATGTSAAAMRDDSHATVELKLKASDGLSARLESSGDRITLVILGRRQFVTYAVHGAVTETGIEARFGALGRISVEFTPTRTLDSSQPPPECEGLPWTTKAGFFAGTIEFSGERHYVEIHSARARGKVETSPDWKCDYGHRRTLRSDPHGLPAEQGEEGDVATLDAVVQRSGRFFRALAVRDPKYRDYTYFYGGTAQRRQGMQIVRAGFASARSATFVFDHERGTAAVSPPPPFRGSAEFRRNRQGSNVWTGSLSVPLLGAPPVVLAGSRFDAKLVRSFPDE